MNFKKIIATTLMLGIMVSGSSNVASATTKDNKISGGYLKVQQQLKSFENYEKQAVIQTDKGVNARAYGSYPKRKGVILVTKDGKFGSLVGHAGIIYSSTTTVESFPNTGVAVYNNNWNTRYSSVYGVTTSGTTTTQDANAANIAYNFRGRPYNWNFASINTTSKFYCSQLVYRAYLNATGKNLNQGGGIVFPIDLVQSSHTYTIYIK